MDALAVELRSRLGQALGESAGETVENRVLAEVWESPLHRQLIGVSPRSLGFMLDLDLEVVTGVHSDVGSCDEPRFVLFDEYNNRALGDVMHSCDLSNPRE